MLDGPTRIQPKQLQTHFSWLVGRDGNSGIVGDVIFSCFTKTLQFLEECQFWEILEYSSSIVKLPTGGLRSRIAERGYPARWYPRCLGAKCPPEMPWLPGLPIESILPWHRLELGTASTPTNHITTRLWARHIMVNHAGGPGIAHSANEIWNRTIAYR